MHGSKNWHDDPITRIADDTLGRRHIAERLATLIDETHSWESSVVCALTGPWGSGKTSLIEMTCERLGSTSPEWMVARFAPWATSDTGGLFEEFYATLAAALPRDRATAAKGFLASCARTVAPAASLIPVAGTAVADYFRMTSEVLEARPPWTKAFAEASSELCKLNTPILVIVDDIDRLHRDELVALLKVVRLLGRFPGVTYLLAYDEATLFANLQEANLGTDAQERARLFMEKIVQYPMTVPPLLPEVMLDRLDEGITDILEASGATLAENDGRLGRLQDVYEAQLTTPRALERLLAQFRLALSMHQSGEIDIVDLFCLTLVRLQFPDLYLDLPSWRRELTQSPSLWGAVSKRSEDEPDWERLLATVRDEEQRRDARSVLEVVFPRLGPYSGSASTSLGAANADYFARYVVHQIPEDDIADQTIHDAVYGASMGEPGDLIRLLTHGSDRRRDLALKKARALTEQRHGEPPSMEPTIALLGNVMATLPNMEGGHNSLMRRQERAMMWAGEMLRRLCTAPTDELSTALRRCPQPLLRYHVVWQSIPSGPDVPEPIRRLGTELAEDAHIAVLAHLRDRDSADPDELVGVLLDFVATFGDATSLRGNIQAGLGSDFTAEDLAARCVSIVASVAATPIRRLHEFDQQRFAAFAPARDPLYDLPPEENLDVHDLSWSNRRAFVRGRAHGPEAATSDSGD